MTRKLLMGKKYIRFGEKLDSIIRCGVGWRKMAEDRV